MMKVLALFLLLLPSVLFAADVNLNITATTNRASTIKVMYWSEGESAPDSTGMSWSASFITDHSGEFDTGIAAAIAVTDSGGIVLEWTAATDHDSYILQFNPNGDGWAFVADPVQAAVSYTHEIGDAAEPRRGEIDYRLYAVTIAGVDTTWSSVAVLPTLVLNQSVKIYSKFHASDGLGNPIAGSATDSWVYRSSVVGDTTPPGRPSGLVGTPGDNLVSLNWDDNTEPDLRDYTVYRAVDIGSMVEHQAGVLVSNYSDNTVTNGIEYHYQVSAFDDSDNESDRSLIVDVTPVDAAPAAPTGLGAVGGDDVVTLDWDDNGEGDLDYYNVYRGFTTGTATVYKENVALSAYSDISVTNDSTYFYTVTAVDTGTNESPESSEVNATPSGGSSNWTGDILYAIETIEIVDPVNYDHHQYSDIYEGGIDFTSTSATAVGWGYESTGSTCPLYTQDFAGTDNPPLDLADDGYPPNRIFLLSFGSSSEIAGGTITSATLHLKSGNQSAGVDSVFVWAAQHAVWQQWVGESGDTSYNYSDTSTSTSWSPALATLAQTDVGPYTTFKYLNAGTYDWHSVDVTEQMQVRADLGNHIVFLFTATSDGTNQSRIIGGMYPASLANSSTLNCAYLEVTVE